MSDKELEQLDDTTTEVSAVEAPSEPEVKVEARLATQTKGEKSIRHMLQKNIKEINKEPDEEVPLTAKERRAAKTPAPDKESVPVKGAVSSEAKPSEDKESSEADKTPEKVIPDKPQASGIAAPAALTKEEKAVWDSTPAEMQKAFLRREADTQKGVEQLKQKYQPIEDVLAPVTPLLQQNGLTPAHAVKQLFDWHRALASPNKAAQLSAFKALAQSHNVDLSSFNTQQLTQQPTTESQPQQVDPFQQIESLLEQRLQPVNQQLANYQAEIQRQKLDEANKELSTFAQDKPYMERPGVRPRMAEILQMAVNFGRNLTLKEAYDQAIWSMDDLRTEMLQEQEAKRETEFRESQEAAARKAQDEAAERQRTEAEAKAEARRKEAEQLEKARRASVSPRGTSPVGAVNVPGGVKKGQSVADTLRATMKDVRSGV